MCVGDVFSDLFLEISITFLFVLSGYFSSWTRSYSFPRQWMMVKTSAILSIMDSFLKKFGKQIKVYREMRGYTQEQLAEKVNVATTTISAWETGKFFLEYPSILKLCDALEITVEDLFCFASESSLKNNSVINEIINLLKQHSPAKQKQFLEILKTFEL